MNAHEFTLQTPALLFPTVSLLMLAYTNRFLGITTVIRKLHSDLKEDPDQHEFYRSQIDSLSQRLRLIVAAQKWGTGALVCCVLSMIVFFMNVQASAILFMSGLVIMAISLGMIFKELSISLQALHLILEDCKQDKTKSEG